MKKKLYYLELINMKGESDDVVELGYLLTGKKTINICNDNDKILVYKGIEAMDEIDLKWLDKALEKLTGEATIYELRERSL